MTVALIMWPETHIDEADTAYPIRFRNIEQLAIGDRICFVRARFNASTFVAHDLVEGEIVELGRYINLKLTCKNQFPISALPDDDDLAVKPETLTKSVGSFRALPRDRDCNNAPTTVIAGLLATVY
jgi:hypothetical protein